MPHLCFTNPGELDPRLITTMGLNVKETPSPIGYFGTGLKYAIAITLRLGGAIAIQSGVARYTFKLRPDYVRAKRFDFIEMQGALRATEGPQTLGFTTDLGKHWQAWQAYRELWSNMKDEGGLEAVVCDTPPDLEAGQTTVIVECSELMLAHKEQAKYILKPAQAPLWSTPSLEVYSGQSHVGFYKNLRVTEWNRPTAFTYNILSDQTLTEDRTLDDYAFSSLVMRELLSVGRSPISRGLLHKMLRPAKTAVEHSWYVPLYYTPRPEVIADLTKTPQGVPPNIRNAVQPYLVQTPPKSARTLYSDLKDEAPSCPAPTCGDINAVQNELLYLARNLRQGCDCETSLNVADEIAALACADFNAKTALEQLRAQNAALREFAFYWKDACKALAIHKPSREPEPEPEPEPDSVLEPVSELAF